jgi:hypothetical protein
MQWPRDMAQMNAHELRDLATSLFAQVTQKDHELKHKQLDRSAYPRDGGPQALAVRPAQ